MLRACDLRGHHQASQAGPQDAGELYAAASTWGGSGLEAGLRVGAEPDWGRGSEGTEQGRGGVRPRGCGLRRDCVGGESRAGGSSGAVPAGRAGPDRRSVWPWA